MAEHGSPDSSPASDNEGGGSVREQDRFLPIANVGRIMKRALPANGKISKDAKETVQECVSEFISFVTGEASDKCQREKRKTINGDDLLWAMSTLGFEEYMEPLKLYLHKYRELEGEKVSMAKQGGGVGVGCPADQSAPSTANGGAIDGHANGPARQGHGHVVYGQPAYQMPYQVPGAGAGGFAGGHGRCCRCLLQEQAGRLCFRVSRQKCYLELNAIACVTIWTAYCILHPLTWKVLPIIFRVNGLGKTVHHCLNDVVVLSVLF